MTMDRQLLDLSSPLEDEASFAAARSILCVSDPNNAIDRLYRTLLRHGALLTAMAHLERAGADLQRLTVAAHVFKTSWPLNSLFPMPGDSSQERIALASIRSSLETHRILLQKLTASVIDLENGILLLYGRALEAAYPSYRHRMDYDVDLLASDIDTGLRLLTRLHDELGFVLGGCKIHRVGRRWLLRMGMNAASQERHLLHIDLVVGSWPAGGSVWLLPTSLSPVARRARQVQWAGRHAWVPAAEDMLLMLGAKARRHLFLPGGLNRKDCNDARLLLSTEQAHLDWNYVSESAASLNCRAVLHELVRDAEVQLGRRLTPPEQAARLAPDAIENQLLRAWRWAREARAGPKAARAIVRKLVRSLWSTFSFLKYARASRVDLWSGVVAERFKETVLRLELRLGKSRVRRIGVMIPMLRTLRRGFGSLCELGTASSSQEAHSVLRSARSRDAWSLGPEMEQVLQVVGAVIPRRAELAEIRARAGAHLDWKFLHHCERFIFSVGPSGLLDADSVRKRETDHSSDSGETERFGAAVNEKVFGIGFSKTGTKTLAACLKLLGYRHSSHGLGSLLEETMRGDLRRLFERADSYESFDDLPWNLTYKELDQRYPNAKFILTVRRDSATWLRSVVDQSERLGPSRNRRLVCGYAMPHGHEAEYVAIYEKHNREVLDHFAGRPDKLLVVCWETGSGWDDLCRFLDKPIGSDPFPHMRKAPTLSWSRIRNKARFWLTGRWGALKP